MSLALSISALFISLLQLMHRAQFWKVTHLFLSSDWLPAVSSPAPVIAVVHLTSIYASL